MKRYLLVTVLIVVSLFTSVCSFLPKGKNTSSVSCNTLFDEVTCTGEIENFSGTVTPHFKVSGMQKVIDDSIHATVTINSLSSGQIDVILESSSGGVVQETVYSENLPVSVSGDISFRKLDLSSIKLINNGEEISSVSYTIKCSR